MKKLKIVFISVTAAVTAIAVAQFAFKADQKPAAVLADAPQPQFVEQGNALDLAPSATLGTAEFAVDNYAVQDGDYLAIDIEGYNGDNIFKIGLNAKADADVFHAVVIVDFRIALGFHLKVEAAVLGEKLEHVVEKRNAGVHFVAAGSVDIEAETDVGLGGLSIYF